MINVELIQAGDGDCIWIEYGKEENALHRILIDGGKSGTYKHLKSRIEKLPTEARHFDLLVITHIDADHIAGVLKLLEADDLGITFEDIWFNGYRHLSNVRARGVKQAEKLSDYLDQSHVNWNQAFHGKAACVDKRKKASAITLPGGMKITLFSPTKKALADLKPKWIKEAKKAGLDPKEDFFFREEEDTPVSRANAVMPTPTELPDIDLLAKEKLIADTSLTNGSSIAFVAEYADKKMFFTGDAHEKVLLNSIKRYYPDCSPLYLDLFKLPHHGSDGNISQALLERIRCSKYLISTNGAYHKHPDQVALAKLIKYGGNKPDIYFNYLSKYTEVWNDPELQKQYAYQGHYPREEESSLKLTFS